MKKLNAAVIGVGAMGKNHARVYSELDGAELAAVADVNEDIAKKVADKNNCSFYVDYVEMLAKEDLDVVSIVVPTKYHTKVALDCIEKDVNILMEKPISDTLDNARKILDSVGKQKIKFMVGHVERFNPAVIELKKRLEKNELGRIFRISSRRIGPFPERIRDVGVIIDLATHDLDIMRCLTGSEVDHVYAEAERRIHTSHEDLLSGIVKFENDVVGVLDVNWLTPEKIRDLSIIGEKGMFVVEYILQELLFYENIEAKKEEYSYSDILMGVTEGDVVDIRIKKKEPLKAELEAFINCVREDSDPPVSGEDGYKALELAYKLIESSEKGKVVSG